MVCAQNSIEQLFVNVSPLEFEMSKKSVIKPILSLQNISIKLSEKTVFKNLVWHIMQKECWAVLGSTGSGKSVLVQALCGELPIIGGEIVCNFKPSMLLLRDDEPEARIGYVSFSLNRGMKSEDNLFVQSRYWSNDQSLTVEKYLSKEHVFDINPYQIGQDVVNSDKFNLLQKDIISLLQIEHLLTREVNMLSNGESRKVAMAKVLLKDPALVIFDNPFQGLDISYRERFGSVILPSLQKRGISIVLVCTSNDEIPALVTHILHINSFKVTSSAACGQADTNIHKARSVLPSKAQMQMMLSNFAISNKTKKCKKNHTLVKMTDVSVQYGKKKIIQGLSWTINKGENWMLSGVNGSGKTTLLSLISGDHPQIYSNTIEVFGKQWGNGSNIWNVKKRIGYVSPELQICYPQDESCINVVVSGYFDSIGLFQRTSIQKRKKAEILLDIFNLSSIKDDPFGSVSEGVQRLVLLLRAVIKMPELLILDEPCQGLPLDYRKLILETVNVLVGKCDCTLIFVTHQPDEIPSCITNVLKMPEGKMVWMDELLQSQSSP